MGRGHNNVGYGAFFRNRWINRKGASHVAVDCKTRKNAAIHPSAVEGRLQWRKVASSSSMIKGPLGLLK